MIAQFCDKHNACREGQEWALANCTDMADVWAKAKPEWLIWVATRQGVLSDKELRLFAVFCVRQSSHLLIDERSRNAIEAAERFANGQASEEELAAAWAAAESDSRAAAWAAALAASEAAEDASKAAARAASLAAFEAAWAASEADRDAARDAAWADQAEWLRKNTSPVFDEK